MPKEGTAAHSREQRHTAPSMVVEQDVDDAANQLARRRGPGVTGRRRKKSTGKSAGQSPAEGGPRRGRSDAGYDRATSTA